MNEGKMEAYYDDGQAAIFHGDCRAVLSAMEAGSFDCCLCDPPYDLTEPRSGGDAERGRPTGVMWTARSDETKALRRGGFMGKQWDATGVAFDPATWGAVKRVLKPGGVLMAFGGTRTWHRLACAVEDAGFVIFDTLMWLYGQGFPKHKTLLKPAWEPIVVAKRPGPGGLHTEAGRLDSALGATDGRGSKGNGRAGYEGGWRGDGSANGPRHPDSVRHNALGRWPANVALSHHESCVEVGVRRVKGGAYVGRNRDGDVRAPNLYESGHMKDTRDAGYADPDGFETVAAWECARDPDTGAYLCPVALLDEQSGERPSRPARSGLKGAVGAAKFAGTFNGGERYENGRDQFGGYQGDTGSASRFFYCAKAPRSERLSADDGTRHPTQKPEALMRWLVALACPPGGSLIDPFLGSGTTLVAARTIAGRAVGIEMGETSCQIATKRLGRTSLPLPLAAD